MQIPFSKEEFLNIFKSYNLSVWPLQILFILVALVLIYLAVSKKKNSNIIINSVLAFYWMWIGIVYHISFFAEINPAAYIFGVFFITQSVLFLIFGVLKKDLTFSFKKDLAGITGIIFFIYSLVVYPLLSELLGHSYPQSPTFGLPCPTVIFTFGMLLWTDKKVHIYILIVPFLWSIIGMSAAVNLGIWQDTGLLIAGVLGSVIIILRNRRLKAQ